MPDLDDFGIEFTELGKCIDFVNLALRNSQVLQIERENIDQIYVADHSFTVLAKEVPAQSVDSLKKLIRARSIDSVQNRNPPGKLHTINQLLERVILVRQPHLATESSLVILLFGASARDFPEWYTQLLNMGCRGLHVGFVEPTTDNARLSHLILVEQAPRGFAPPGDWARNRGWSARALTFYQFHADQNCPFFIEWGYEYPVADLDRLYQLATENARRIFVCAKAPHQDRLPDEEAREPHWLRVSDEAWRGIFHVPDETLDLKAAQVAPRIDLKSRLSPDQGVLEFRVQRDYRNVSSMESIENQIAWHQQAIEQLQHDYRVAHALRQDLIYLAYVFEQTLADSDGELPALNINFSRLLDQPYSYLRHLLYGFYDHPSKRNHGLHVVIDERQNTYTKVWTQLASEIYIQRRDWRDLNLMLFVRNGDVLHPRLEDQEMLQLIRKVIWDDHKHPHDQPVLLRTRPSRDNNAQWEALYLTGMAPLTDSGVFRFLHRRFPQHVLEFRREIPNDIATQLGQHQVELNEQSQALQREISQAVEEEINKAEEHWRHISERIDQVNQRADQHRDAVAVIEETINVLPPGWDEFVGRVLASNNTLLSRKIDAWEEFREAQQERDEQIKKYEDSIIDSQEGLENDRTKLSQRRQDLEQLKKEADELKTLLTTEFSQIESQQRTVLSQVEQVKKQVAMQLKSAKGELAVAQRELEALQAKTNELRRLQAALEEQRRQIRAEQASILQLEKTVADLRQRVANEQRSLSQERDKLQKEQKQLQDSLAEKRSQLDQLLAEIQKVRTEIKTVQTNRDELKSLYEKLENLIQTAQERDKGPAQPEGDIRSIRLDGELPKDFLERLRQSIQPQEYR